MFEITIRSIYGQRVDFSDGSTMDVPWYLTPHKLDTEITLVLDCSRKTLRFPLDVSKKKFMICINVLLIDRWKIDGKKDKRPVQVPLD